VPALDVEAASCEVEPPDEATVPPPDPPLALSPLCTPPLLTVSVLTGVPRTGAEYCTVCDDAAEAEVA
jgi:hypothetical protein